jgi:hypothetical protein
LRLRKVYFRGVCKYDRWLKVATRKAEVAPGLPEPSYRINRQDQTLIGDVFKKLGKITEGHSAGLSTYRYEVIAPQYIFNLLQQLLFSSIVMQNILYGRHEKLKMSYASLRSCLPATVAVLETSPFLPLLGIIACSQQASCQAGIHRNSIVGMIRGRLAQNV